MEWRDKGVLVHLRPLGERKSIATLFTRDQGIIRGVVYLSRKNMPQLGMLCDVHSKARLSTQLGVITVEALPQPSPFALILREPLILTAFQAMLVLVLKTFQEHDPHQPFFDRFLEYIQHLCQSKDLTFYVRFELDLLSVLGFGLDLNQCAITGEIDNLYYISPKTGRAVTEEAGKPYHDKLFIIPAILHDGTKLFSLQEVKKGLDITGHFLGACFHNFLHEEMPVERERLMTYINKAL